MLTATVFALALSSPVWAEDSRDDFLGYWKTAEGDGVIQLERCAMYRNAALSALCGTLVWDVDVDNPRRTTPVACNRKIFEAARFEAGVWKNGWAFDVRRKKFFSAKLRLKDGQMHVRVYVGSEMNGETMVLTRVGEVPPGCEGKKPEATTVSG
jgi:uncharacterized protein (DUF2147 family)